MNIFSYTKIGVDMNKKIILNEESLNTLCKSVKILGDESRLKIILYLFDGEKCVGDIAENCSLSQSATSHQLRILKDANILKSKKVGNVIYYSVADNHVATLIETLVEHLDCKGE